MPAPINPIVAPVMPSIGAPGKAASAAGGGFSGMLGDAITRMDQSTKASQEITDRFLSGENEEVHSVALAAQRNELQFALFLQVRNKIVQAYQEVMRMQM